MKANELRIGNYVKAPLGEISIVDVLGDFKYPEYIHASFKSESGIFSGQNGFEGIPLTPEILEKCGFKKHNNAWVMSDFSETEYNKDFFTIWNSYEVEYNLNTTNFPVKIEHLHQLQNLYFCLVGEELEVKL